MKRKPVVFLVVLFPILLIGWLGLIVGALNTFAHVSGVGLSEIPDSNGILLSLSVFFLWIPIALLLSNLILYTVRPLRRIADQYAKRSAHPGFGESQRQLLIATAIAGIICVPLMALSFYL